MERIDLSVFPFWQYLTEDEKERLQPPRHVTPSAATSAALINLFISDTPLKCETA